MSQLAIKGHPTRGEEVIEILGILGGSNAFGHIGNNPRAIYYINEKYKNFITCYEAKKACAYIIFTLEEFLEKFPYKVGDKVSSKYLKNYEISKMGWESINNRVIYKLQGMGWYAVNELQPYKEEAMKKHRTQKEINEYLQNTCIKNAKDLIDIEETLNNDKLELPNNVIINRSGICSKEFIKWYTLPQYPKTYEECCNILGVNPERILTLNWRSENVLQRYELEAECLFTNLYKLKICRDAYWKIAGEEMGLGNPWKPRWNDNYQNKWTIYFYQDDINLTNGPNVHFVLAFPTKEMRDAFYENFKELIETCKELL